MTGRPLPIDRPPAVYSMPRNYRGRASTVSLDPSRGDGAVSRGVGRRKARVYIYTDLLECCPRTGIGCR